MIAPSLPNADLAPVGEIGLSLDHNPFTRREPPEHFHAVAFGVTHAYRPALDVVPDHHQHDGLALVDPDRRARHREVRPGRRAGGL
jgi:hypothetical protein